MSSVPSSTQSWRAKERWFASCSSVTWVIKTAPPPVKSRGWSVLTPATRACAAPPPRAGDGRSASSAPTDRPFPRRWRPPWSAAAQSAHCNNRAEDGAGKKIYCKINKTQIELIFIKGCFFFFFFKKKETVFMMLLICVRWKVILYRQRKTQINIPEKYMNYINMYKSI